MINYSIPPETMLCLAVPEIGHEMHKAENAKNKLFERVLSGLAAALVPCICF